eukprot:1078840-Pelagomonas_calceolata.AAC.1
MSYVTACNASLDCRGNALPFSPCYPYACMQVQAREAELRAIAEDPCLYDRLVASFAPNIWEMEDVKKGLLTQLFGGMGKAFPGGRVRGEINVLLVSLGEHVCVSELVDMLGLCLCMRAGSLMCSGGSSPAAASPFGLEALHDRKWCLCSQAGYPLVSKEKDR